MATGIAYFDKKSEAVPPAFFERVGLKPKTKEEAASVSAVLAQIGLDYVKLTQENLDDLVLCLVSNPSPAAQAALVSRVNNRVMFLLWTLFQYDYTNENIIKVLSVITKAFNFKELQPHEGVLVFLKDFVQNPLNLIAEYILSRKEPLEAMSRKYGLMIDAPFFRDVLIRVFACAPPDLIRENVSFIEQLIKDASFPVTVLIRYLYAIPSEEFSESVCLYIIEKLGAPPDSEFWRAYPPDVSQKILGWHKIYKTRAAYPPETKKYKFFSKYMGKLSDVAADSGSGLVKLLFGQFTTVDDRSNENEFVLCFDPKASMRINHKEFKKLNVGVTAKDYILQGKKAEHIKVILSSFDKAYADELFDSLLNV